MIDPCQTIPVTKQAGLAPATLTGLWYVTATFENHA
jgi:hypothetical protein